MDRAAAQALVDAAHKVCPYSNATRGNINVAIKPGRKVGRWIPGQARDDDARCHRCGLPVLNRQAVSFRVAP